jgi:GGDEF domain-containing protein
MRDWKVIVLATAIIFAVEVAALLCPASFWRDHATILLALPLLFYSLAAMLGMIFAQTRVVWLAIPMAATTYLMHQTFFVSHDSARARALVILSSALIPCLVPLFYRLNERGLLTPHGMRRAALAAATLLILLLGPLGLRELLSESGAVLIRPMSAFIPLPALSLLTMLLGLPFLVVQRDHESPNLGPCLGLAMLAFLCGLCFTSALWSTPHTPAALLLPMSVSGLLMLLAVLESAWRHANMDELTDLPSRRAMRHRFRCLGEDFALATLDLDHFKRINDQHGHDVGDQVLRFVSAQLKRMPSGTAYRFGGEEFVIACEGHAVESFEQDLERLRESIAKHPFCLRATDRPKRKPKPLPGDSPQAREAAPDTTPARTIIITITVSIGVARRARSNATPEDVFQAADKALYRAKEEGRNRICSAP